MEVYVYVCIYIKIKKGIQKGNVQRNATKDLLMAQIWIFVCMHTCIRVHMNKKRRTEGQRTEVCDKSPIDGTELHFCMCVYVCVGNYEQNQEGKKKRQLVVYTYTRQVR